MALPNWMNFWGSARVGGGGFIFNPKIYIADFENFKQGFLSMKLIQKSNFRADGIFPKIHPIWYRDPSLNATVCKVFKEVKAMKAV